MKKTLIILGIIIGCGVGLYYFSRPSDKLTERQFEFVKVEKGNEIYYHSALLCPAEKPLRKVRMGQSDSCDVYFFSVDDDYFNWYGKKICKIPKEEQKKQIELQTKIKEKQEAFTKDYAEEQRVEAVLLEQSPSGCFSTLSVHRHGEIKTFTEHEGECTKEELEQLQIENRITETLNKMIEEGQMEKYGKDCFSCDDEIDFLTDKQTCDFCPNREMKGALCIKKETK